MAKIFLNTKIFFCFNTFWFFVVNKTINAFVVFLSTCCLGGCGSIEEYTVDGLILELNLKVMKYLACLHLGINKIYIKRNRLVLNFTEAIFYNGFEIWEQAFALDNAFGLAIVYGLYLKGWRYLFCVYVFLLAHLV